MAKTKAIDFSKLTLKDALDLAELIEEEAKERYGEFADQMDIHRNPEAARFFRFMLGVEQKHEDKLGEQRKKLFGDAPREVRREMLFDIEAPEYDETRAKMTVREALDVSLRAEEKAYAFFDGVLAETTDPAVRELFSKLRDEEGEHQLLVKKQIAKLPPEEKSPMDDADDEDDGPVAL